MNHLWTDWKGAAITFYFLKYNLYCSMYSVAHYKRSLSRSEYSSYSYLHLLQKSSYLTNLNS